MAHGVQVNGVHAMKKQIIMLALAGCAAVAHAGPGTSSNDMFDERGRPTEAGQAYAASWGLPRFVEGAPFRFSERQNALDAVGCVTVQFVVTKDGLTDRFVVLDSKPKGEFDQSVLDSLKFWRFEPTPTSSLRSIKVLFGTDPHAGTHLSRWDQSCLVPRLTVTPDPALKIESGLTPYYPPALFLDRVQGCALIGFTVGPNGLSDEYEILDAVPDKRFAMAAIQALNDWRFAKTQGSAPRSYVNFDFRISGVEAPEPRQCQARGAVPAANH